MLVGFKVKLKGFFGVFWGGLKDFLIFDML